MPWQRNLAEASDIGASEVVVSSHIVAKVSDKIALAGVKQGNERGARVAPETEAVEVARGVAEQYIGKVMIGSAKGAEGARSAQVEIPVNADAGSVGGNIGNTGISGKNRGVGSATKKPSKVSSPVEGSRILSSKTTLPTTNNTIREEILRQIRGKFLKLTPAEIKMMAQVRSKVEN